MLWLSFLLHASMAMAEEPSPLPAEPLFCTDPVAAVCEPTEKILPDLAEVRKLLDPLRGKSGHPELVRAAFAKFKEMEKQSFIPLFDETRARLLETVATTGGLADQERQKFKSILENVKFVSLSGAPDVALSIQDKIKKLPATSILRRPRKATEAKITRDTFNQLSPLERELVQKSLIVRMLNDSQDGCGEALSLNAFSIGADWDIPSVALCLESMLRLKPLDVQTRYPILGMVFAHELGHHLDFELSPDPYTKLISCVREDSPDKYKKFNDRWRREIVADFWAAAALGNMVKTRAALMEEPPEVERNRARRFVRGSLNWFCDNLESESRSHPTHAFRIRRFGEDPGIRKMLGCRPKPACGLSGRQGAVSSPGPSASPGVLH